ncbi:MULTISPECIES: hypothetical protein [Haloarcula]|uniref:hypothetical protein n=1 Tax=Haloarcula TaxID=2237 RepID=UPI0023E7D8B9|nr:hypothetical protein [Halomicroarcula sp. SHR3]
MVERCGFEWPAECLRVERRADEAAQAACCARPVADGADRCRWHAGETLPEDSDAAQSVDSATQPAPGRRGPFTELLDGSALAGCTLRGAALAGTALRGPTCAGRRSPTPTSAGPRSGTPTSAGRTWRVRT